MAESFATFTNRHIFMINEYIYFDQYVQHLFRQSYNKNLTSISIKVTSMRNPIFLKFSLIFQWLLKTYIHYFSRLKIDKKLQLSSHNIYYTPLL
jgi:hypothetical protein